MLLLFALACCIPLAIFRGYVIVNMWNWFVLTQFSQAPHLTITGAIGLSFLIGLLHLQPDSYNVKDMDADERVLYFVIKTTLYTVASWAVAYVIHCFM